MVESARVYARNPRLLLAFTRFNSAVERPATVGSRLKNLAVLKAATIVECEFCIDIGSELARRDGISDQQLLALPRARESGLFSEDELLVLDLASGMSRTPAEVDQTLITALRKRFGDKGTLELCHIIAWENHRTRLNAALGLGAGGFSEGRVCAIPERQAAADGSVHTLA
jgi:4-carboxymuconolactone decarboxylase